MRACNGRGGRYFIGHAFQMDCGLRTAFHCLQEVECSCVLCGVPDEAEDEDVECWFEGYDVAEGGVKRVNGKWQACWAFCKMHGKPFGRFCFIAPFFFSKTLPPPRAVPTMQLVPCPWPAPIPHPWTWPKRQTLRGVSGTKHRLVVNFCKRAL